MEIANRDRRSKSRIRRPKFRFPVFSQFSPNNPYNTEFSRISGRSEDVSSTSLCGCMFDRDRLPPFFLLGFSPSRPGLTLTGRVEARPLYDL